MSLPEIRDPLGRNGGEFVWMTAGLEPCDGRNCRVGTISWPRRLMQRSVPTSSSIERCYKDALRQRQLEYSGVSVLISRILLEAHVSVES